MQLFNLPKLCCYFILKLVGVLIVVAAGANIYAQHRGLNSTVSTNQNLSVEKFELPAVRFESLSNEFKNKIISENSTVEGDEDDLITAILEREIKLITVQYTEHPELLRFVKNRLETFVKTAKSTGGNVAGAWALENLCFVIDNEFKYEGRLIRRAIRLDESVSIKIYNYLLGITNCSLNDQILNADNYILDRNIDDETIQSLIKEIIVTQGLTHESFYLVKYPHDSIYAPEKPNIKDLLGRIINNALYMNLCGMSYSKNLMVNLQWNGAVQAFIDDIRELTVNLLYNKQYEKFQVKDVKEVLLDGADLVLMDIFSTIYNGQNEHIIMPMDENQVSLFYDKQNDKFINEGI